MTTFRLLHASDLHLAMRPYQYGLPGSWWDVVRFRRRPLDVSSHDPDVQTAFAAFASSIPSDGIDYDILILSGDLATTGRSQDLRVARGFVETPAASGGVVASGKPCLNGDPQTVVLIPGNHDRFGPVSGVYHPGNQNFDALFQPYWQAGVGGVQQLWERDKKGIRLVLLGADLTLRAGDSGNWLPFGWLGQGRAYPHSISALRQATQAVRAEHSNCTVIWVIHFLPFNVNPWLQLLDAQHLLAAARDERIPAILCGHSHGPSDLLVDPAAPGVQFCLCGSTTQYHEPNGNWVNLLDIAFATPRAAPRFTLHRYRYDPLAGLFL